MSQLSELDLGACFGDDRLDEPMTQEQFLQQTPARCALGVNTWGRTGQGLDPHVLDGLALVCPSDRDRSQSISWGWDDSTAGSVFNPLSIRRGC